MIKYKTGSIYSSVEIESVEIERETESSIWIKGRMRSKRSRYEIYHASWQDAHDYLFQILKLQHADCLKRINRIESDLKQLEALERPE